MRIIKLDDFVPKAPQISLSLGFFDGVHLGHQEIILNTVVDARLKGRESAVFTFYRHPMSVIAPAKDPPKLNTIEEKQTLMSELGIDYFIWAEFDTTFRTIPAEHFVKEILVEKIGVKSVFAGPNYYFGFKAEGTPEKLVAFGALCGFEVTILPPIMYGEEMVSSTLVREIISAGDVVKASHLLGRFYVINGRVSRQKCSKTENNRHLVLIIEYPEEKVTPKPGVYAVYFTLGMRCYRGLCYLRIDDSSLSGPSTLVIYPLDAELQICDPDIQVHFLESLRWEENPVFPLDSPLVVQEDISMAETIFSEKMHSPHLFSEQPNSRL